MALHCPRYGSASVTLETEGYGGMIYRCTKCGFSGAFIVESDDQIKMQSWADSTQAHDALREKWLSRKSLLIKVLAGVLLFLILVSLMVILVNIFWYSP
jgi:hypothetical protein